MKILGYKRPDNKIGIRNYLLILPVTRGSHILASKIAENVTNCKTFILGDEDGRDSDDRNTISRVLIGLGLNPNVGAVLLVCNKKNAGYDELLPSYIESEIAKSGKKVYLLDIEEQNGFYQALGQGIRIARRMAREISDIQRTDVDFGKLTIGVKCGLSDATSGISGNPTVGYMLDALIDQGGTAFFSETTEVIGAEEIVAKRCRNDEVKQKFLECVYRTENEAKSTGEDIRTINPIPANIEAGITTLEEKSLGAIAKAGTRPINGVLRYAERPKESGLYFVDSWMSSTSLFIGYAAAGANMVIFQMGGGALPVDPPMPSVSTGLIAPILYTTGNPKTYKRAGDEIDFNCGTIIEKKETISQAGERLIQHIQKVASGMYTKMETWNYQDPIEVFLKGPKL
ncbi:MAG TPA: UxaA family hydrolase [Thermoclostridium caenicola]|uniref:UxaA family hydrolase n=1 Tax=Thermoclostridium caenicola TaxID=659425 RepID=UPI002D0DFA7B|nr:UxaA family hydrolase [Thermoclostridium caenicola]HPO76119.1 UxaA family hydrolase [Thermoclostridium caenicola]